VSIFKKIKYEIDNLIVSKIILGEMMTFFYRTPRLYFFQFIRVSGLTASIILLLSVLLSSCVSSGGTTETGKFATQGCIGGVVIGGVAGAAIGGKEGAIIGAIGGCIAGLFTGVYFAERKAQYASKQRAIIEEIAWNKKMTAKLRATNAELAKSIKQYQAEVQRINNMRMNDKQRQMIKREEKKKFRQKFGVAVATAERVQEEVKISNTRYEQYHETAQPAELAEWQNEITAFEQQGNLLNQNVNLLLSLNDSL
jgi:hypothetical protein